MCESPFSALDCRCNMTSYWNPLSLWLPHYVGFELKVWAEQIISPLSHCGQGIWSQQQEGKLRQNDPLTFYKSALGWCFVNFLSAHQDPTPSCERTRKSKKEQTLLRGSLFISASGSTLVGVCPDASNLKNTPFCYLQTKALFPVDYQVVQCFFVTAYLRAVLHVNRDISVCTLGHLIPSANL